MNNEKKCLICGLNNAQYYSDNISDAYYMECPICGNYILHNQTKLKGYDEYSELKQKIKHYLFYHKDSSYKFIGTDDEFEDIKSIVPREFENKKVKHVTIHEIENWYPKTFAEKINYALLYLGKKLKYDGDTLYLQYNDAEVSFFTIINRDIIVDEKICRVEQIKYFLNALKTFGYIEIIRDEELDNIFNSNSLVEFNITPAGLEKIYNLQQSLVLNKNVFVAMKFGDETNALRDKLKEGIEKAGYLPRIMDEIEHNHQIVPEMLYEIKNCRFVIAELSHHNNGAYYEAGYALGMGKEVIHICKSDELKSGLHFDVAQVNTIVYDNIDELPDKIVKRIKSTIG